MPTALSPSRLRHRTYRPSRRMSPTAGPPVENVVCDAAPKVVPGYVGWFPDWIHVTGIVTPSVTRLRSSKPADMYEVNWVLMTFDGEAARAGWKLVMLLVRSGLIDRPSPSWP